MSQSEDQITNPDRLYASPVQRLDIVDEIAELIAKLNRSPLNVLDAGAGRSLHLKLPSDAHLTGIDISEEALRFHTALHTRIVGDLQSYPLPEETFDVIICWDVLEHLQDPVSALDNMSRALAKGGLLVIGGPNFWSPKALLAKFTPYRFHLFVYRHVLDTPDAGKHGNPPFPTFLRITGSPNRLVRTSSQLGLSVTLARFYSTDMASHLPFPLLLLWNGIVRVFGLFPASSRGDKSDFVLVLSK